MVYTMTASMPYITPLSCFVIFEGSYTFSYSTATADFTYNPVKSRLSFDTYFITSIFPVLLACLYKQKCAHI